MPDDCGSTRFSAICAATAASVAVPPRLSTSQATLVAIGFAATAITVREKTAFLPGV